MGQWDRDLTRAASKDFTKILAAGRVDAGGLRVSRSQIEAFKKERGYLNFLETSAKSNMGCGEIKQAILDGIRWENIPCGEIGGIPRHSNGGPRNRLRRSFSMPQFASREGAKTRSNPLLRELRGFA